LSDFGPLLRRLRRQALLTQEHLAELAGVATRTVRELERGRTGRPHADTVRLLADALQLRGDARARFESSAGGSAAPATLDQPQPLSQLPPEVPDFTGRHREVADLMAHLGAGPAAGMPVAVVSGRAGVGKTALAVHVAHRLRARFPDGQLFLHLGAAGAPEALSRALRSLGVPGPAVPEHVEDRAALYRAHLSGRRVLVLVDNAAAEAQVRPLLPGGAGSAALVTSRGALAGLEASRWLTLVELEPESSLELLSRVAGAGRVEVAADQARTIVGLCGGLPLAVRIAGARLATERRLAAGDLAARLADERRRLDELRAGDLAVRTSFNASYEALDAEARRLFGVLGLLDAPDFPAWVPAALLDRAVAEVEDTLGLLAGANLLDVAGHDAAGRRRYRLHDLLAAYARERVRDERVTTRQAGVGRALDAWLSVVDWVEARVPEGVPAGGLWRGPEAASLTSETGDAGWAAAGALVAFSFELRAHWDRWPETRQVALAAAGRVGDRLETPAQPGALVVTPGDAGPWGDLSVELEACAAAFREIAERRWYAATLLMLGNVHRAAGRVDEAAAPLEDAVGVFRELGARGWEAMALLSLGSLQTVQGCLDEAVERYEACLAIFREREDRTWEAYALRGLGYAYQQHGRWEAAVRCLERALPVLREAGDQLWEGHTELTLAYAQRGLRRFAASLTHAKGAEAILHRLGDERGEVMARRAAGAALLGMRRLEEARTCCERCLDAFRAQGDPISTARATCDLGHVLRELGRGAEAAACFLACLPVFRERGLRQWEAEAQRQLDR